MVTAICDCRRTCASASVIDRRYCTTHRRLVMTTGIILGALSPVELGLILCILMPIIIGPFVLGAVLIQARQVGVVVRGFGTRALPPGRVIVQGGEAGYQLDTLAAGLQFRAWPRPHRIFNVSVVV